MAATLLLRERYEVGTDAFAEIKVWRVPVPLRGSEHSFKYSLAYVVSGVCVVRYDNEAGKGDHRHAASAEGPYSFTSLKQLIVDFERDVETWRPE